MHPIMFSAAGLLAMKFFSFLAVGLALKSELYVLGDVVKHEYEQPNYTREVVTIKTTGSAVTYRVGTVLAKFTSTGDIGKYQPVTDDASDGTQTAAGVLLYDVTVPAASDASAVALVRGPAVVDSNRLVFTDAGISGDANDVADALAQLKALGIIPIAGSTTVGPV